jgi:hypothetical protein
MKLRQGLVPVALSAISALGAATLLTGCVTGLPEIPAGMEHITYDPSPPPFCFGCAVTSFTLAADGSLWLTTQYSGRPQDRLPTRRRFVRTTPETYATLRDRLAPYRTARDSAAVQQSCEHYLSDNDGLVVTWSGTTREQRRAFDFNCEDDQETSAGLRAAPVGLALSGWEAIRSPSRR